MTELEAIELAVLERRRLVLLSRHPTRWRNVQLTVADREGVGTLNELVASLIRIGLGGAQ